ncbi:MAG TPA: HAMP domain-containing sensor histidine kinase [Hyphomonadaceae bacterium]|nr:HAMP domain-containing sensor histidine kinase [Hyphomonadaceae bacterium]HPN07423.1 HAMP domain-containing sensor histidine kinase [Hyphomonadaceae bacterium]
MRGSTTDARIAEIESTLWVAFATLAAASTGGSTAMIVIFAVAVAVAWASGSSRLTGEIAGFSFLALIAAIVAGAGGSWIQPNDASILAMGYGVAGVVLVGAIAVTAAPARQQAVQIIPAKPPVAEPPKNDPALAARLRKVEADLRNALAVADVAKAEVEVAKGQLEQRTTFFAQTSHELRTPLNAIVGFADMMRNAVFGPLPDRYQEYATLIHEGGQNLTLIVDDVLDLARLEAGRYEIHRDLLSLTDMAYEAVHFMRDEATRKQIELELVGDDVEAFADSKAVRQIALNLISNALKFTPAGGRVEVSAVEGAAGALLAVSDTGVGISPEELTRLSRAFEQGGAGKKQKGAGLGLSVVRAMAELHGGRLDIESREGGGSTIAVFFPAEKAETPAV